MLIEISNKEERKLVAAILIDNGYTVKKVKIQAKGKSAKKTCLEAKKEQDND